MKRLIALVVITITFSTWFHFSHPGNFTKSKIENSAQVELNEVLSNQKLLDKLVMVNGIVIHSISTNWGGTLILQYENSNILILSRGFTPSVNEQVSCVLIPRKALVIGKRTFIICALVDYNLQS